jgi:hypothetical protein
VKGQQVYLGHIEASAADVFSIVSALRLKGRWNHGRVCTCPPLLVARMRNLLELNRPVFRLNIGATSRAPREEKHKGLLGQIA